MGSWISRSGGDMESENGRSSTILREWFDRVDSQNEGNITAAQLKSAFAIGNLHFPLSDVQQMIRMYDFNRKDYDGDTISFQGFVELNKFLLKVQQAFADLEGGLGYLITDDVHKGLVKIGISLNGFLFDCVCERFDQDKIGRFGLDDFTSLCIFVQSARNLFNSFDASNHGRVTLDLTEFLFCTAYCRI